jgi:pimeloyl-ACP methyl ester carboxylesterase
MATVAERLVHANGIDIHVTEAGHREAPPLVLLHGGLVSTNPIWEPTPIAYNAYVAGLAARFRVIAPDERGCGRTTHTGGSISMSLLADDVAALIEALELRRPAVAGFSAGGLTATILGIRHPGVVRAIVNDAGYDFLNPQATSFAMMRQMLGGSAEATEADPDAAAALFASQPEMAPMFETMRTDQDAGGGPGHWRTYLTSSFERTTRWPGYTFADLATIDVPTLVLVGDRDHFCTAEEGVATYRHLESGQLAVVPDTGHVITPAKIALLMDFLLTTPPES